MTIKQLSSPSTTRSKPFSLLQNASSSYARNSLICLRRQAATIPITLPNVRACLDASPASSSIVVTSSSKHFLISTPVGNVVFLLTFRRGASHPFWRRFHSCIRRPQRRSRCPRCSSSGRSCARSRQSNSPVAGDASLRGGSPNSSLSCGNRNSFLTS